MEQLMAVAESGKLMPSKSTWLEPKLADGLLTHVLDLKVSGYEATSAIGVSEAA